MTDGIRWPINRDDVHDSGEGGLWVYAMVRWIEKDPMVQCCGPTGTLALPLPDVVAHDPGEIYGDWRTKLGPDYNDLHSVGDAIVAAVLLGSSRGSWVDETIEDYWRPQREDLTEAGLAVVDGLAQLYDRPVHLTVYLDT